MTYDISAKFEIDEVVEAQAVAVKDSHRAERRARTRAASQRQLTIARDHNADIIEEAGRFRKHHSLAPHHTVSKGKPQRTRQELSFAQDALHDLDCAANDEGQAAA